MNVQAARAHPLLSLLLALSLPVLTSCITDPPMALRPTPSAPASPAPSFTPTAVTRPASPTATADVVAAPQLVTATLDLAPLQPLRSQAIVDRTLGTSAALTNGTKKYKAAVWSPQTEWIAAVPQDGPGLDVVSAKTGELHAVVTDTYVLEPVWLEGDTLVVHQVANNKDVLLQYRLDGTQFASEVIAESEEPLLAVDASAGTLSYASGARLNIHRPKHPTANWSAAIRALVSAPAPSSPSAVAVAPWVADLQQVQTVLVEHHADRITSTLLSNEGEGLWLPQWAPDATKLALTHIGGRIVTTTVDGRSRYDLGPGDRPAWSPDGSRIAYAGTSAGKAWITRDIHIVDWQGAGPRLKLTSANDEQFYTSPSWSPDGTRIAFVEIDSGQIFVGAVAQP